MVPQFAFSTILYATSETDLQTSWGISEVILITSLNRQFIPLGTHKLQKTTPSRYLRAAIRSLYFQAKQKVITAMDCFICYQKHRISTRRSEIWHRVHPIQHGIKLGATPERYPHSPRISHESTHHSRFSVCLLYTSPSPRDLSTSRMPSSA